MNAENLKSLAAVGSAAILVIGGTVALVYLMATGTVTVDAGLPILSGIISGATGFLWAKSIYQDGLNTPTPNP